MIELLVRRSSSEMGFRDIAAKNVWVVEIVCIIVLLLVCGKYKSYVVVV